MTNKTEMKTMNIKGNDYVLVNERIKAFRNNYKDYRLITELLEVSDKHCMMMAKVIDPNGVVVSNGFAREVVEKNPVNKFAFVENCETSAVGRALGMFGIGVDKAICSAEELTTKLAYKDEEVVKQDEKPTKSIKGGLTLEQRFSNFKDHFEPINDKSLARTAFKTYEANSKLLIEDLEKAKRVEDAATVENILDKKLIEGYKK